MTLNGYYGCGQMKGNLHMNIQAAEKREGC